MTACRPAFSLTRNAADVHYHCSPTRRSFISGRLPIHHGEELSAVAGDDVDLRWTLIGSKLAQAGYRSHWVGKSHTGYKSMAHLPVNRGFDSHLGFLGGSQYCECAATVNLACPTACPTLSEFAYRQWDGASNAFAKRHMSLRFGPLERHGSLRWR